MIANLIFNVFIIVGLIGIMFKIDYIIEELEKLTGSEKKKTFRERMSEIKKERESDKTKN